ncbi:tetraspanin-1-like [Myxocyprinus asiaticus]|uniref:tetraspanin-1-like n=1 Tax=Myxocyprinus asiaticus TaxID=70543 RepID=UPI002221E1A1|nr:tetraspanin-1-like [Myxocyprinus asiaticus]
MKGTKCLKLVTSFFSLVALIGGGTAGMGIWSKISSESTEVLMKTVDESYALMIHTALTSSNLLIAGGCFLFIMGLVGCCGTLKKQSWMLLVFFFAVLIIFILQIIGAVFTLLPNSLKEKSLISLETKVVETIEKNYKPNTTFISMWDEAMNKLKCCGYKGYDDFTNSSFVKEKSSYPMQCCDSKIPCKKDEAMRKGVKGCSKVLLEENIPGSAHLSFLMGIVEIVAMVISLKVYRCLKYVPFLPD